MPLATTTAIGHPSNPYLRPTREDLILASKGTYSVAGKHDWPTRSEGPYLEWMKDTWLIPPGQTVRSQPLAFPDELVYRLVRLFSSSGDVVLDPFAGTGVVGRVARLLGRQAWLIEREPTYWPRLEAVLGQGVLLEVA